MASRPSVSVSLTPDLKEFVADRVSRGRYPSAGEMVREGLRLLEEREVARDEAVDDLRRKIAVGLEQSLRGELFDGDEVFDQLEARSRRKRFRRS